MWTSSSVMGTFTPVEELSKPCSQDAQAEWGGSWRKPKELHTQCDLYVKCKGIIAVGQFSGCLATFLRLYAYLWLNQEYQSNILSFLLAQLLSP